MAMPVLNGLDLKNKNISNLADPASAQDAATRNYVDNAILGLNWKANVRVASTANLAVASAVVNGASVDGVTLVTGDRILLKNQTAPAENGIYLVAASGAASRTTDADTAAEVKNMIVRVSEGTTQGDSMWQMITDGAITLGTTGLSFTQFTGGVTYTADGNGIELVGAQFQIELDGTTLQKSSAGIRIGSGAAGAGLIEASGVLAVGAGTGISVAADAISVDTSIVVRKYAANCAATTNPQTFTDNLGTLDKQIQVVEVATGKLVWADITEASTNTFTVDFGGAPTAAQYRVLAQA